jgi:hypothetical protein
MRLIVVLFFVILGQTFRVSAQDKRLLPDLQRLADKSDSVAIKPHYETGFEVGTSFTTNLKGGYGFEKYISPRLSFQSSKSWRFDINAVLGSSNYQNMSTLNYNHTFQGLTGTNSYFGFYGQGTYKVNDKLYFGTSVFIDKMAGKSQFPYEYDNKTNYNGSLFIGYKFSDKVSMQAGFDIHRNNDPWNMNNAWYNGGYIP